MNAQVKTAAHTPGPWYATATSGLSTSTESMTVRAAKYSHHVATVDGERSYADAALIAAAPDLLAALKDLLAATSGFDGIDGTLAAARAAIAKAGA